MLEFSSKRNITVAFTTLFYHNSETSTRVCHCWDTAKFSFSSSFATALSSERYSATFHLEQFASIFWILSCIDSEIPYQFSSEINPPSKPIFGLKIESSCFLDELFNLSV